MAFPNQKKVLKMMVEASFTACSKEIDLVFLFEFFDCAAARGVSRTKKMLLACVLLMHLEVGLMIIIDPCSAPCEFVSVAPVDLGCDFSEPAF